MGVTVRVVTVTGTSSPSSQDLISSGTFTTTL